MQQDLEFTNIYTVQCLRKGKEIWKESVKNLVTTEGINDVLSQYFKGTTYTATHFAGLKGPGTISAADTAVSHPGWSEFTNYTGGLREAITLGAVASGSVNNSAAREQFTITAPGGDVAGVIVTTVQSGSTGVLYGAADFAAVRPVLADDVLLITVTFTAASA